MKSYTLRPDTVTPTELRCTLSGTFSKWRFRRKLVFAALAAEQLEQQQLHEGLLRMHLRLQCYY